MAKASEVQSRASLMFENALAGKRVNQATTENLFNTDVYVSIFFTFSYTKELKTNVAITI